MKRHIHKLAPPTFSRAKNPAFGYCESSALPATPIMSIAPESTLSDTDDLRGILDSVSYPVLLASYNSGSVPRPERPDAAYPCVNSGNLAGVVHRNSPVSSPLEL